MAQGSADTRRRGGGIGESADPVRRALRDLYEQLPALIKALLGILVLLIAVGGPITILQQALGYHSAGEMFGALGWVGGFWLLVGLVVLAMVTIVLLLRRRASGGKSTGPGPVRTEPPPDVLPPEAPIGREDKLVELRTRLRECDEGGGFVTVVGTGGVGKTRLCQELLKQDWRTMPGGGAFVRLENVKGGAEVAERLARELGEIVSPRELEKCEAIAAMLRAREAMLVVLDNFENVDDEGARMVAYWADAAPHVRLVVSSQRPLDVRGERILELEPFNCPQVTSELLHDPPAALRLFWRRAADVKPGFELTPQNVAVIAEVCDLVGGLPWAIEAAAVELRQGGSLEAVRDGLRDTLAELSLSRKDVHRRHRSVATMVDWMLSRLSAAERRAAVRMAVFPGAFSVDAVGKVVDDVGPDRARQVVGVLREERLLQPDARLPDRYSMYAAPRAYCRELYQAETPEQAKAGLFDRLVDYYVEYVKAEDARIDTEHIASALDRLESDYESCLQVFDDCVERGDFRHAAELFTGLTGMLRNRRLSEDRVARLRACLPELLRSGHTALAVRSRLEIAVAHDDSERYSEAAEEIARATAGAAPMGPSELAGHVYLWRGIITTDNAGDNEREAQLVVAAADLDEAERLYLASASDPRSLARLRRERAHVILLRAQHLNSRELCTDAWAELDAAERAIEGMPAPRTRLLVASSRADVLFTQGHYDRALRWVDEAIEQAKTFSGTYFEAPLRSRRAGLRLTLGAQEPGDSVYDEAAEAFRDLAEQARRSSALRRLAACLNSQGDALVRGDEMRRRRHAHEALKLFKEAEEIFAGLGLRRDQAITIGNRAHLQFMIGDRQAAKEAARQCVDLIGADWTSLGANGFVAMAILAEVATAMREHDASSLVDEAHHRLQALPEAVQRNNAEVRDHAAEIEKLLKGGAALAG